jgi:aspartokinase
MIVMKFGGTSVESRGAIARLVRPANSQLARRRIVVVSALGKTTNRQRAVLKIHIAPL